MKSIVLSLVCGIWAVAGFSQDCDTPAPLPYLENFSNGNPACWLYENTDGANPVWSYNNSVDFQGDGSNDPVLIILPSSVGLTAKNDWAFSHKVQLEAGTQYTVTTMYNALNLGNVTANENFEMAIASTQSSDDIVETLGTYSSIMQQGSFPGNTSGNDLITNAYTASETFVPATSGEYYIGIHATGASGSDGGGLLIFSSGIEATGGDNTCEAVTVPYYEDFSNGNPFCWTAENTDGISPEWQYNIAQDITGNGDPDAVMSIISPGINNPEMNDWLFTQKIQLEAGVPYYVSTHYNAISLGSITASMNFQLVITSDTTSGSALQTLATFSSVHQQGVFPGNGNGNDLITNAHFDEETFTPDTAGAYYIAFHAMDADQLGAGGLLIVDVAVNDTPTPAECAEPATIPYTENFSSGSPDCWGYTNADDAAPEWTFNGNTDISGNGSNDSFLEIAAPDVSTTAKDDWAFSKKIALNAGTDYKIDVLYNVLNIESGTASENFALYITNEQSPSATFQSILGTYQGIGQQGTFPGMDDGNDLKSQAYSAEEVFTPDTAGNYYVAIHATGTNGVDAGGLIIFNVKASFYYPPSGGEALSFPGNTFTGVNANGTVAVGANNTENIMWTEGMGIDIIGGSAPGQGIGGTGSISDDGNTISAQRINPQNSAIELSTYDVPSGTWTPHGGIPDIGGIIGGQLSSASGISAGGDIVVGLGWLAGTGAHAISYTEEDGVVDLGSTVADRSSRADGVSADGSVIGGWQDLESGFRQGAIWVDGVQQLLYFPNGEPAQAVNRVSDDGIWVGGDGNYANNYQAWRWSEATGIESIGPPIVPGWRGSTYGITPDGSTIVGFYKPGAAPAQYGRGFIWTEATGIQDLNVYANSLGIDTLDVTFAVPTDISADGSTIVGTGQTPSGRTGFILKLTPTAVGIHEVKPELDANLYPNPVQDQLTIQAESEIQSVDIFNITGQKVLSKSLNNRMGTINVSKLAGGVYVVKLQSKDAEKTFKVIKL